MTSIEVSCPGCKAPLQVPPGAIGKKGRCNSCRTLFVIQPAGHSASGAPSGLGLDDTVLGWLDSSDGDEIAQPFSDESPAASSPQLTAAKSSARPGAAAPSTLSIFPIRLDSVDPSGAVFRFSPKLLYDENFRASFPQQCAVCGSRKDLMAYQVIWSGLPQAPQAVPAPVKLAHLGEVHGRELLRKLSKLRDLPEPYSLPFPYYLCGTCPPAGALQATVVEGDGEGQGCTLKIASLAQAEAVLACARGMDCEDLLHIRQMRTDDADPWLLLPTNVRVRLGQWYKPQEDEYFQAYITDREFSTHESGKAGIVVTNKRMICHKSMRDVEISLAEPIDLRSEAEGENLRLHIESTDDRRASFLVQHACLKHLWEVLSMFSNSVTDNGLVK